MAVLMGSLVCVLVVSCSSTGLLVLNCPAVDTSATLLDSIGVSTGVVSMATPAVDGTSVVSCSNTNEISVLSCASGVDIGAVGDPVMNVSCDDDGTSTVGTDGIVVVKTLNDDVICGGVSLLLMPSPISIAVVIWTTELTSRLVLLIGRCVSGMDRMMLMSEVDTSRIDMGELVT